MPRNWFADVRNTQCCIVVFVILVCCLLPGLKCSVSITTSDPALMKPR